ncbi:MAG TPA: 50S ribosomal protein L21 [Candidatus Saccharimonadales bacterium]|nr:50S ribosomal protein L21 [Candidatus Saccharimonadales bacterium]
MKKAVIQTGGKQYIVQEGETFEVELIKSSGQKIDFEPLLIVDGSNVQVGAPILTKNKVSTEVIEADKPAEKVTAIRYKAKKRVRKVRGHRQHHTVLKVTKIV